MTKTGIYYGSSTGTTQSVAEKIAAALHLDPKDLHDISSADAAEADAYDFLILGTSTWGDGEMQDDWYDFVNALKPHLNGKKVALFGLGDSSSYDTTYCDGMGLLYDELEGCGCTFVGSTPTEGYSYSESKAERNGRFVGLCLDEDNESDQTDERIEKWIANLA